MNTEVTSEELAIRFASVQPGATLYAQYVMTFGLYMLCLWPYKNRPVKVICGTRLFIYCRDNAIQANGMNVTGLVFKICLKHFYGNMKFTFCDDFLDGHLMSSNSKHPSDETATAAGTSAPSTDS